MGPYDYPALEGGWGWLVVLSGFCIHVLTRGCLFSTGILFSEWTMYFEASKSETSWIGSIATGCALMIGPVASRLMERFGYRKTAIAGSFLSFVGLLASSWANSIFTLCLTYGAIAGSGMGISYLCGVVAVGEYFDRRRSVAFGISAAGSGFGAAVMAILQQILIDEFGWRGSLIILAGLSGLNQLVCAMLLRPLSSSINWKSEDRKESLKNHALHSQYYDMNKSWAALNEDKQNGLDSNETTPTSSSSTLSTAKNQGKNFLSISKSTAAQKTSSMSPALFLRRKQMISLQENLLDSTFEDLNTAIPNQIGMPMEKEDATGSVQEFNASDGNIAASILSIPDQLKITSSDAVYLSNLSIASSRKVVEKISKTRSFGRNAGNYNFSTESLSCYEEGDNFSQKNMTMHDANNNKKGSRVLSNPLFLVLAINQFLTGIGIMIPFIHLSQKAILMGFSSKRAAYLISIIGIGNIIGKVSLGIICDMKWSNVAAVFIVTQFGLALSVAIYPVASTYGVLVVASLAFGFFYGNYCAIPSLLVQFVGLNNLAEAIGYITFLEGVAGIIGPPMAGAIYDSSKSYKIAFAGSAAFLLMSSIVIALYPLFRKRLRSRTPIGNSSNKMDHISIKLDYNENNIAKYVV